MDNGVVVLTHVCWRASQYTLARPDNAVVVNPHTSTTRTYMHTGGPNGQCRDSQHP